jgi:1-acyl-sn-glycerol-3-phosphate acyltransferase
MFYKIGRIILKGFLCVCFRLKITGRENIPESGGAIYCANHIQALDPLPMFCISKRKVHILAKAELYKRWIFRKILLGMNTIPVNRGKSDVKAVRECLKVLKDGEILGIFPEGTRVKEGETKEPEAGIALFAVKQKVPVVPIYIEGKYRFRNTVKLTIGKPFELKEYYGKKHSEEEYQEISKKIMKKVYDLSND